MPHSIVRNVTMRELKESDIPAMLELSEQMYEQSHYSLDHPNNPEYFLNCLTYGNILGAFDGEKMVGYAILNYPHAWPSVSSMYSSIQEHRDTLYATLSTCLVHINYRNHSLHKLFCDARLLLIDAGVHKAYAIVRPDNKTVMRNLKSCGFQFHSVTDANVLIQQYIFVKYLQPASSLKGE